MVNTRIAVVSSSTRTQRHSHRVALYLRNHFEAKGATVLFIDLLQLPIPMFEETIDKQQEPDDNLLNVSEMLTKADAMIFVSPEYNGGYTSALKNMVDHFPKSVFYRKPVGVVSVSTGGLGGMRAATQMQALAVALYALPVPQMLLVPQVLKKFDEYGELIDETFTKNIEAFAQEFIWLTAAIIEAKQRVLH